MHSLYKDSHMPNIIRPKKTVAAWYPPLSRPRLPLNKSVPPIPDQLFTFSLYAYDFERNTWYPDISIKPSSIYPVPPPAPLSHFIKTRYAQYEEKQFELLKAKLLQEEELRYLLQEIALFDTRPVVLGNKFTPEKQKEMLMDKQKTLHALIATIKSQLDTHAKEYAAILDLVNTQVYVEKQYEYNAELYEASNEHIKAVINAVDSHSPIPTGNMPERKNYTLINTALPFDLPKRTHTVPQGTKALTTSVYKAPAYALSQKKEEVITATPDFKSVDVFPSLSSSSPKPAQKKVTWGKSLL